MNLLNNHSLKSLNTFGLNASAEFFSIVTNVQQLLEALDFSKSMNRFILGGGSNILLTRNIPGLTIKIAIPGIDLVDENSDHYFIKTGAGENWHKLVMYCVERNYCGIENLSLIPGNVGAGPMQNIGAYGVELKDVFHTLEALDIQTGQVRTFGLEECEFGYRTSIFKTKEKGRFVILSVTLKLSKKPVFRTSYGAIQEELERMSVSTLSIRAISDAVIRIRRSKLPDPAEIGNAGSFFKNPTVPVAKFNDLLKVHPDIPGYPQSEEAVKLAAGWLIEKAGWKGWRKGDYGVHKQQALVLVNYGRAVGKDIYTLSEQIAKDIFEKFGVELEREVNVI